MSVFMGMPGVRGRHEQVGTARDLLEQVVFRDLCIGCGACTALPDSPLQIAMGDDGRYRAEAVPGADVDQDGGYLRVCPFSSQYDEDQLAQAFHGSTPHHTSELGGFRETFAGHVSAGDFRQAGSSGGMTTWFLHRIMESGEVDAVLHVGAQNGGRLFGYRVSTTDEQVRAHAKTRYYPIEMSEVLDHVRHHDGRYAVVGLPCFIKAVRLLQAEDELFAERVRYCVGIVCGHLKSTRFADTLAWQQGVAPGELAAIDFRKKTATRADAYAVQVTDRHGTTRQAVNHTLAVSDWGVGLFKYPACDWCDDVMNETADIVFGDAWLPEFADDPEGANVAVVRSAAAATVVSEGDSELERIDIGPGSVAASQSAGLRHRREGLAYRLAAAQSRGEPVPRKRVSASKRLPRARRRIYDLRSRLIVDGDRAFAASDHQAGFQDFWNRIGPSVAEYRSAYHDRPWMKVKKAIRTRFPGLFAWAKRIASRR
ncbi:Coenzyme F420 hydrogenase/dehydrogenase, beta subunit C-terminal domain [Micrococcus luteus]|nr:Coenzyme F420 hydrogenase/dehydrogenase, beta subunit C-terminal domain [Micrococcus luteus]MCT2324468.1 Coenzyme F420 hydrogenase/dehydrogenase, beta subunit C-terminal domain [Micrococcus luteus]MCV7625975.1 Coenzyme F420 hydrogenase/dehydrogenase, beta subunit C-terminal domain [Micrococcus luteus]